MSGRVIRKISAFILASALLLPSAAGCAGKDAGAVPSATDAGAEKPEFVEEEHFYLEWEPDRYSLDGLIRECLDCGRTEYVSGWAPAEELQDFLISPDMLDLAAQQPPATYDALPMWYGVSIAAMDSPDNNIRVNGFRTNSETIEKMAAYGFNYTRILLDMRCFYRDKTMKEVNTKAFLDLDNTIRMCIQNGIHCSICSSKDFAYGTVLKNNPDMCNAYIAFWNVLAERYKDIPSNALDFDLCSQENNYSTTQEYGDLINKAIDSIREISPDRLIVVNVPYDVISMFEGRQVVAGFTLYVPNLSEGSVQFGNASFESVIKQLKSLPGVSGDNLILNDLGTGFMNPAEDVIQWFDEVTSGCEKLGIPWNLHDYYGWFGFATSDVYSIRSDTPYTVVTDEKRVVYVYPDILESLQKNMKHADIQITADQLRQQGEGVAPKTYVISLYPALRIQTAAKFEPEEPPDYNVPLDCVGDIYTAVWDAPYIGSGNEVTSLVITPAILTENYAVPAGAETITGQVTDASIWLGDGSIIKLYDIIGRFEVANGGMLETDLAEYVSGMSSEDWKKARVVVSVRFDTPEALYDK